MEWKLTEEQELARDSIREWVEREVAPVANELDAKGEFPLELFKRAGELGFIGLAFSEKYGGSGMSYKMEQVLAEEIGKELPSLAMSITIQCAVARGVLYFGTEEQKMRFLPKAASGEWIFATTAVGPQGCTNFTEGSEIGVFDGDEIVVNCEMPYATNGEAADVFVLNGKVGGKAQKLLVMAGEGVEIGHYDVMGVRNLGMTSVSYRNVRVPVENILVLGPNPTNNAVAWLNYASNFLGATEGVFERTVDFIMNRSRMGKPLGTYQAPAHAMAKAKLEIEAMRAMIGAAAATVDEGKVDLIGCFGVKAYSQEAAAKTIKSMWELWGGIGVTEEAGVARFLRDALALFPGELTAFALYDIIAQHIGLPVETQLDVYRWVDIELD